MRRMVSLLVIAALLVPLAGCLSPGGVAEVPDEALRNEGWKKDGGKDGKAAASLVSYYIREYAPSSGASFGRLIVVTAPDIPLLNEGSLVDQQLEQIAAREGIELQNPKQTTLKLTNGLEVGQTVYDVQKSGLGQAKLRKVQWTCNDGFVAAIGYGVVAGAGGLGASSGMYEETGNLVKTIDCP